MRQSTRNAFVLLLSILPAAAQTGCERPQATVAKPGPPKVSVSLPIEREVTDFEEFTGRTESPDSVQVRARVTGYLDKIHFKDGEDVKEGDVLYEIDPRPYIAQLDQDKADLVNKKAVVQKTEALYRRTVALLHSNASSQEEVDVQKGDWEVAKAAVGQAEAKVRATELNVTWTKVRAPISGRLSRTYLTRGNLVNADITLLTTIMSLDPMWAYFDVDEQTMLHIQELIREGKVQSAREKGAKVPVFLALANENDYVHEGYVDFVNNRVDPATGTLQVRGVFANPVLGGNVRRFSPGMFVRVRVSIGTLYKAVLISDRAIAADQGLQFVYVVNDKDVVVRHEVTVGQQHDGLQVIQKGLNANERVIVSGLQRVRQDMPVTPTVVEMPGATAKKK
jgi:RND family efflux transporter MFP subunit